MLHHARSRICNATRSLPRRNMSTARQGPKKMEGGGEDPRPPWVYTSARLMSLTLIPGVSLYSIFFYDFGDRDHVFQPFRRVARDLTSNLFSLSPTEEKIVLEQQRQLKSSDSTSAAN